MNSFSLTLQLNTDVVSEKQQITFHSLDSAIEVVIKNHCKIWKSNKLIIFYHSFYTIGTKTVLPS